MRDYGKVSPQFWVGETGKALRKRGLAAQVMALYLLTNPHANMLGLYYLPTMYAAHETGLGLEGACEALSSCMEVGFCEYDEVTEMVWVREMAAYQIDEALKERDNRILGIQRMYDKLPGNPFLAPFFEKYGAPFRMTGGRTYAGKAQAPMKPLGKPLGSQEQEQEQEQDQRKVKNTVPQQAGEPPAKKVEDVIFDYWKQVMDSPRSKIDKKRTEIIRAALKWGYTPEQLCRAVDGCRVTPHNMGINDRGEKYNGIHVIFRSADQIDRFTRNADNPPRFLSKGQIRQAANGRVADGSEFLADVPPEYRDNAPAGFDGMTFEG